MRTFIAADFPPETIQEIQQISSYLKTQMPHQSFKWVSTKALHLTIKFLGDIPEKELAAVKDIITQVLQEQPSFTIEIEGLGMYPNIRNPHVIWLGITHVKLIVNIHKMLDQALEKSGIKADRRKYSPHLTIARIRRGTGRDTITKIGKTFSQFKIDSLGPAVINEIRLYQSELTSIGPIYTPLLSIPLNQV